MKRLGMVVQDRRYIPTALKRLGKVVQGQRYIPTADFSIVALQFLACKAYSEGAMLPRAI